MQLFANLRNRYRFVRPVWRYLFALIDAVGAWLCRVCNAAGRPAPKLPQPSDVRRLLLVQLDHLGDAVISTTLLPAIRKRFSQAQIDVLAAPWNCEVFAVRRDVGRIQVSVWNRFARDARRFFWPFSTLYWGWTLRRRQYDLAIDVRGDFSVALMLFAAGVRYRVGWKCAGGGFLLHDAPDYVPGRPEVESRRQLLLRVGVESGEAARSVPRWEPSLESERFVRRMMGDFARDDRPLYVFHLGAGTTAKTWPMEHWRELLGRVIVELDGRVVLVGGRGDSAAARDVTEGLYWPNVMDWTGRLTLDQLAAVCRRAALYIGADSGPAHLAAAVGTRSIVLFSGTNDAAQWKPHGEHVTVLRREVACAPCYAVSCPLAGHPCLRELTPAAVMDTIEALFPTVLAITSPHWTAEVKHGRRSPG